MEGTADNYWFQAKIADQPTGAGINEGRVFKLTICKDSDEYDYDKQVYHYSRGIDVDKVDEEVLNNIIEFCENNYGKEEPPTAVVSEIKDIEHLDLRLKLYINDYDKVLTVLFVNGYPNVLHNINDKAELEDTWASVNLYWKKYDVNIVEASKVGDSQNEYHAVIYGIKHKEGQQITNFADAMSLEVELATNAQQSTKKMEKK